MRLTFRAKLLAIVGIAGLAFLLLIMASAAIANRVEAQVATIQERYLPKVDLEPTLDAQLERISRGFQDAVAARDMDGLAATRELEDRFFVELAAAGGAVDPSEAAALKSGVEDYYAAGYDVSKRLIADETGEGLIEAIKVMQAKQARAAALLKTAATLDRAELAEGFAAVARAESRAKEYRLSISIACLVSVVILSLGLSRGVLRSLSDLREGFVRFGKGEFERPIVVRSRDELRDVAEQANLMAVSLERSARERRKAEKKFQKLLEAAPDAMVIIDEDRRIVLVNAQAETLFGYPREELLDQSVELLVPERHRGKDAGRWAGRPSNGDDRAPPLDLYGRRKDGTEFPIEVSTSPLETEEGALVSSAIRDITQRKRTESELMHSNRELEAFSYAVAHDLRAPLRGINGFSRALIDDYSDKLDDDGKHYLERIGAGSERMGELIDALLALSRVTRTDLQRESVNLSRLADTVLRQLRLSQPERALEFVNQEDVVAYGDPRLLRAVFENLLGNAWKFTGTRASARIEFGASETDGTLVYSIRDNGAGFDMAYADKLFTPFQRLHSVKEFAGTGIGLATVQRIVSRHGGRVWAKGVIGEGATFHFTLANAGGGTFS